MKQEYLGREARESPGLSRGEEVKMNSMTVTQAREILAHPQDHPDVLVSAAATIDSLAQRVERMRAPLKEVPEILDWAESIGDDVGGATGRSLYSLRQDLDTLLHPLHFHGDLLPLD